ncbi:MAG TPA: glutamate--tRNA ligase [Burkholderiales bacterium]|nr:glutamate--tRNA ligase [Burkholderiales bacterium]
MIRTRFAPSPTGSLHLGGARTALFAWAYARKHRGVFVLRIEDTDIERSIAAAAQAILDAMNWLGLDYDEGPIYQSARRERYGEVAERLLRSDQAYYCYATPEELEAMREEQRSRGLKPRYDGRWRDSTKTPPVGVKPVIRFKNPSHGAVEFNDLVKGPISVSNEELDDLVIVRADGAPTYNFSVVVDDLDMAITHVIRGDDHVNNTPRQLNIIGALGGTPPQYAHVPMILGKDGERLSKRHGAMSVMQYKEEGYLPEAMINYLARLGWSHGDQEIFSREQLVEWFDLGNISKSPARFDPDKLRWVNQQHMKRSDAAAGDLALPNSAAQGYSLDTTKIAELYRERVSTGKELEAATRYFFTSVEPPAELRQEFLTPEAKLILQALVAELSSIEWNRAAISDAFKRIAKAHGVKLPKIAMPLRVAVTGEAHTPPIDAVLELFPREIVLERIRKQANIVS